MRIYEELKKLNREERIDYILRRNMIEDNHTGGNAFKSLKYLIIIFLFSLMADLFFYSTINKLVVLPILQGQLFRGLMSFLIILSVIMDVYDFLKSYKLKKELYWEHFELKRKQPKNKK